MVHLLLGFALGAVLLANRGVPIHPALARLRPAHAELLLIGWTVQLAMGVAFWILPRFRPGPERGDERPAWAAWALLNLGVLTAAMGAAALDSGTVIVVGRSAEALAAVAFARHAWPRVKPFG
jgi:hypothetical protein